jgi:uncharacterized membrane protein required for colicin V production
VTGLDIAIVAAVVLAALGGLRAGFVRSLYGLVTWIVSLAVALALSAGLALPVAQALGLPAPTARALAVIAIALALEGVFGVIGRVGVEPLARAIARLGPAALADRALGLFPAVARMLITVAIALGIALVLPAPDGVRAAIDGSPIARALVAELEAAQRRFEPLLPQGEAPLLVTRVGADERYPLDVPDGVALDVDPQAERRLLELANEERVRRGLAPLAFDERLVPVARGHADEMLRLKYFGHLSPRTGTPFDRLAAADISYRRAGENLAYAQSATVAHRGLMESQGHRENILRPEFTHIGVGVVSAGPYGRVFVQLFLERR